MIKRGKGFKINNKLFYPLCFYYPEVSFKSKLQFTSDSKYSIIVGCREDLVKNQQKLLLLLLGGLSLSLSQKPSPIFQTLKAIGKGYA